MNNNKISSTTKSGRNLYDEINSLFYYSIGSLKLVDIVYGTIYIIIMKNKGLTILEMTTIFSISSFMLFIFEFPSGVIADLYGRKKLTAIGFLILAAGYFCFSISASFFSFLVSFVLIQLGIALESGNIISWFYDITDKYKFEEKVPQAMINASIIIQIIAIIGSLFGSSLNIIGENNLLYICSVICIIAAFIIFFSLEDNFGREQERAIHFEVFHSIKKFLSDIKMRKLIIYKVLVKFLFNSFIICWQLYLLNSLKAPEEYIGVILMIFMVIMLLAKFVLKYVKEKVKIQKILILSVILVAFSFLIMYLSNSIIIFVVGASLFEFSLSILLTCDSIWTQEQIPSKFRSSYAAALDSLTALASSGITILLGFIMSYFSISIVWGTAFVVSLLLIIYYYKTFYHNIRQKEV